MSLVRSLRTLFVVPVLGCLFLSGCSSFDWNDRNDRAAGGAVVGGATGALVGGVATKKPTGALVGAAIGAVTGAILGSATTPKAVDGNPYSDGQPRRCLQEAYDKFGRVDCLRYDYPYDRQALIER